MTAGELAQQLGVTFEELVGRAQELRFHMADADTTLSRTEIARLSAAFGVAVDGVEHRPTIDFIGPGVWSPEFVPPYEPIPIRPRRRRRGRVVAAVGILVVIALVTLSVAAKLGPFSPTGEPIGPYGMQGAPAPKPVPPGSVITQKLADSVKGSTTMVVGGNCSNNVDMGGKQGSGWVVAPDLIATNAHVASNMDHVWVYLDDGTVRVGNVVAFSPDYDVAIIRVKHLNRKPLKMVDAKVGTQGVLMGHPIGEPLSYRPFVVTDVFTRDDTDIYHEHYVHRPIVMTQGVVAGGASGSALMDPSGNVIAMVWGYGPDNATFAVADSSIRAVLRTAGTKTVPHSRC